MKRYETLPKELPVPDFLNEKILRAAADFSARRRQKALHRRIVFGGAAAAAAMLIFSFFAFPQRREIKPQAVMRQDVSGWSAIDQESFVLCAELNSCNLWDEEFSI
ncbi:MAG: hypothetical protein MJ033_07395 [Victivallaceae bacterium]|nr:hypothetical protein [Victivallaceae bacterium]